MKRFGKLLALTTALFLFLAALPVLSAGAAEPSALSVRFVDDSGNEITEAPAGTTVTAQVLLSGDVQAVKAASLYLSVNAGVGDVSANGFEKAESFADDNTLAIALWNATDVALSDGVLCSVPVTVGQSDVTVFLLETAGDVSTGLAVGDDESLPVDLQPGVTLTATSGTPGFAGAQLVLSSSIGINFYVKDSALKGATSSYAKVTFDLDRDGTPDELTLRPTAATVNGVACQRYFFDGIAPDNMGQAITARLYYTDGEGEHEGLSLTYSVTQYITNTLESMEKHPESYKSPTELRALLAHLLAYGRASEEYTGKSSITMTTALEELLAKASTGTVANTASSNKKALYYAPGLTAANAAVTWSSVGLNLRDNAALLYVFKPAAGKQISDYTLKLTVDGETESVAMSEAYYEEAYGAYVYRFRKLGPCDMSKTVKAYFLENSTGKVASGYLQYSVESYAYSCYQKRAEKPALNNLTQALIRFGNSVKSYFAA